MVVEVECSELEKLWSIMDKFLVAGPGHTFVAIVPRGGRYGTLRKTIAMGLSLSSFFDFGETEIRVLMVGLDGSGKTTILNQISGTEARPDQEVEATNGFNLETVDVRGIALTIWDIGGKCLPLYYHYYQDAHAFIFVVDSSDQARMKQAGTELAQVLKSQPSNRPVLVLANKQDLLRAMPAADVRERLVGAAPELSSEPGRKWIVYGTSGADGSGLNVGLEWLTHALRK